MYPYAFYSRILAVLVLVLAGLVGLPTSIQYFRLKTKVNEAQGYIQAAQRDRMVMGNLVPQLAAYSHKDPSILPLLQKYGIVPPPGEAPPAPAAPPKPKKK
jgi:hypothetical protein